ncbi:MAG: serine hydroxymethyltransferase, partial [Candidatus Omnitrophota bacterium]
DASTLLEGAGITVNKNLIPFDSKGPAVTSGIRLGTAAITTRGIKEPQISMIAGFINEAVDNRDNPQQIDKIREKVTALTKKFPLYPDLKY